MVTYRTAKIIFSTPDELEDKAEELLQSWAKAGYKLVSTQIVLDCCIFFFETERDQ